MEFGSPKPINGGNYESKPIHPEKLEAMENARIILSSVGGKKIELNEFIDETKKGYSAKDIEIDRERVRLRKEDFDRYHDHLSEDDIKRIEIGKLRADALEAIIIDLGGSRGEDGCCKYGWYGENAYFTKSAEPDDILNGVDGTGEFLVESGESHKIALAIDASMRADVSSLQRKIERGVKKVADGKMEVKYFKSATSDYKGKLRTVLPVVLGLEGDKANELIRLFSEIVMLESKQERTTEEDEKLAYKIREAQKHPCQVIFLREMKVQLEMYQQLFNREGSYIKHDITELLKIVDNLLVEKQGINMVSLEHDGVYEKICEVAKDLPKRRSEIFGAKKNH